jgi:hypothetical protein
MVRQPCFLAVLVVATACLVPPVRAAPATSPEETSTPSDSTGSEGAGARPWNLSSWFRDCVWPEPECQAPDGGWACCYPTGVVGHVEYLNWAARRTNLDYAAVVNPAQLPVPATGFTRLETFTLDFARDEGLRAGIGCHFAAGWDLMWTYTQFHTEGQTALTESNVTSLGLIPTRSIFSGTPSAIVMSSGTDKIEADGSIQLKMHDIEGDWRYRLNETVDFRGFAGFRLAFLDEQFNNQFSFKFQGFIPEKGGIQQPIDMVAAGLRCGAELGWRTQWGLRVFGSAAPSILVADFKTRQFETNTLFGGTIIDQTSTTVQVVPVLEAAVGVGWCHGPWEVSAGYEVSDWFNMVDVARPAQTLFLDGWFVRLALTR